MSRKALLIFLISSLILGACSARALAPEPAREREFVSGAPVESIAESPADEAGGFGKSASLPSQPDAGERMVIKNADLSVVVDDPAKSVGTISQMAERMGGFVVSSNLFRTSLASGEEVPQASITIRVPADRLAEALSEIEKSAVRVTSKNESGQDVTQEYTDLQSRLRNLEDAEEQLRSIMDEARRTEDVLSVFNQLTQVREQIEVIKGQIQYFEQSAAFSAIRVELIANAAVQPLTIGGWQPAGVAKSALQALITALQFLVNVVIWLALFILPVAVAIAIPLVLIWRGARGWRARRRQARLAAQTPTESGN